MNKKTLLVFCVFSVLAVAVLPMAVSAVAFNPGNNPPAVGDLPTLIGRVLSTVWIVVAAIAVAMFITAGVMFMTAAGSPDKVATGRQTVIWAVIGLVVAIIGFSIQTILSFIQ